MALARALHGAHFMLRTQRIRCPEVRLRRDDRDGEYGLALTALFSVGRSPSCNVRFAFFAGLLDGVLCAP